jgi:hypothetical protein
MLFRLRHAGLFGLALMPATWAQPLTSLTPQTETQGLIELVAQSGCSFERNGKFYDAKSAAEHLRMKLKRAGPRVSSAEQFIAKIASNSYLSGQLYRMRCPGEPEQSTSQWLTSRLHSLRQQDAIRTLQQHKSPRPD